CAPLQVATDRPAVLAPGVAARLGFPIDRPRRGPHQARATTMPILTEDLEYHRPAEIPLLARFYRPEGQGPFPAVLEVHGGAWTSGDRLNNVSIAEHLAAHGIVVLSIDFRMPP